MKIKIKLKEIVANEENKNFKFYYQIRHSEPEDVLVNRQ